MRSVKIRSVAKINLDLRVLHRRADGFHELRTVFQTISLADTIEIEYEEARRTELTLDGNVDIPDNLILRAAGAALEVMKVRARVRFRLKKSIPMGGGLGGGSSNAAAVLLALPVLAGRTLRSKYEIAARWAATFRFFWKAGRRWGWGGEPSFIGCRISRRSRFWWFRRVFMSPPDRPMQALSRGLTFTESSSSINSFQGFVRALGIAAPAEPGECAQRERLRGGRLPAISPAQNDSGKAVESRGGRWSGTNDREAGRRSSRFFGSKDDRERARRVLEGDRVFRGLPGDSGQTGEPAELSAVVAAPVARPSCFRTMIYGRPEAGTRDEVQPLQGVHGQRESRPGGGDLL